MNNIRATIKNYRFLPLSLIVLILLATLPTYSPPFLAILLISVFMYIILGTSWLAFCGPTNYISLATAAFFGVGVYTTAVLTTLPLPIVMVIGGLLSFVLGIFVGLTTLRLRGMYFCIFTFGLTELFRHTVIWYECNITGALGRWPPLMNYQTGYYYMLALLIITLLSMYIIRRSRLGFALRCVGQSEDAASHIGINVNAVKIITFAITCFFMGATGTVMATRWSYIDPDLAFAPFVTFFTIMMVLVGGWSSTFWGPIIGATVLVTLADTVLAEIPNMTMLLFGFFLLIIITLLPGGIMGLVIKKFNSSKVPELKK